MTEERMPEDICLVPMENERIRLRQVKGEDAEYFVQMLNNPRISRFLMRNFPLTLKEEEGWIEDNAEQAKNKVGAHFTIELKPTEENQQDKPQAIGVCGIAGIDLVHRHGEAGIFLGEDYLEKGYGTEAAEILVNYGFEKLNLHRINSAAVSYNKRSIALQEKLGFEVCGRQDEMIRVKGEWHDLVLLGIKENKWRNQKARGN